MTLKFFILSTCVTTLSTCELVGDNTVNGINKIEEKPKEVADIRMLYNPTFLHVAIRRLSPGKQMIF